MERNRIYGSDSVGTLNSYNYSVDMPVDLSVIVEFESTNSLQFTLMGDSPSPGMTSSKTMIRMPTWVVWGNICERLGMAMNFCRN